MMESTFDMAYRSYNNWTTNQCVRMLVALRERLANEQENTLKSAGLFDTDPLYQPVTEEQFRHELLTAQKAYCEGDRLDALAFCDELEHRKA